MKKVFFAITVFLAFTFAATAQSTATLTTNDGQTLTIELSKATTINLVVDNSIESRTDSGFTFGKNIFAVTYEAKTYSVTLNGQPFADMPESTSVTDVKTAIKKYLKR